MNKITPLLTTPFYYIYFGYSSKPWLLYIYNKTKRNEHDAKAFLPAEGTLQLVY